MGGYILQSKEGVDYQEEFSLDIKYSSIRIILSLVTEFDLELAQLDVKTAFLQKYFNEICLNHSGSRLHVKKFWCASSKITL